LPWAVQSDHARQYHPTVYRFGRPDPVFGNFNEPATLHAYLYCLNDPINRTDPAGEFSLLDLLATRGLSMRLRAMAGTTSMAVMHFARGVINNLVAARNFLYRLAASGERGLDLAVRLGRQGERAARAALNFAKNSQRFYTAAGNFRIPDGIVGNTFYEVKNVAYQPLTAQIRDLIEIAAANNATLTLIVRQGTKLSGPLQALVDNGTIELIRLID